MACLEGPRGIIVATREHLVQRHPAAANEVIGVDCVAVPHVDTQLAEPLDEWYMKLLVEGRVPSPIGAGAGAQLGVGVLDDDVGVLAREELGVPQLPAPRHSDLEEQALDRHGRAGG